jgi:hypothetical protein
MSYKESYGRAAAIAKEALEQMDTLQGGFRREAQRDQANLI